MKTVFSKVIFEIPLLVLYRPDVSNIYWVFQGLKNWSVAVVLQHVSTQCFISIAPENIRKPVIFDLSVDYYSFYSLWHF